MTAPDPYAGMTELQVFNIARDSLRAVQQLPDGPERQACQARFDAAMIELGWRAIGHALAALETS